MEVSDAFSRIRVVLHDARRFAVSAALPVLAVFALLPTAAHAVGTPAGTNIQNTATVDYSVGGTPLSMTSNTTSLLVAETVNVAVALQSSTVAVTAGAANEALVFLVTNSGNGPETFALTGDSALIGDDFDPMPATPFIYFDSDASGDLSPADVPYVAGGNDPLLAADASVTVILVNDIPAATPDGDLGRSELRATSTTGSGAPGTAFPGQGFGGVDAVIGTSGGEAAVFGEYLVGNIQISAVKSQTVSDPFGGTRPIPGATITYQIVVTATGAGAAIGTAFNDAIPADTTYVTGSATLNGAGLTDSADADAGTFVTTPPAVTVALGDLTAASGPQTIVFRVTID
ncbi:MAG TPA: hypothetical protein VIQ99_01585 [Gammaproteobacteria bacterium]